MSESQSAQAFQALMTALDSDIFVLPEGLKEEELLLRIEERLIDLLSRQPEAFFQLMYRLDVAEKAMQEALQYHDAPGRLARLVYERQLQKVRSRADSTAQKPFADEDTELQW